jgi:opacity protein-like surface antigen
MLNGSVTLDLRRYRARIGPYLSRIRPYLGYGIGGAQLWFRNTETVTKDPTKQASVSVFEMDEFVFARQFFAGVEYNVNDRFSIYGEYRKLELEDFGPASNFEQESWMAGLRMRY